MVGGALLDDAGAEAVEIAGAEDVVEAALEVGLAVGCVPLGRGGFLGPRTGGFTPGYLPPSLRDERQTTTTTRTNDRHPDERQDGMTRQDERR